MKLIYIYQQKGYRMLLKTVQSIYLSNIQIIKTVVKIKVKINLLTDSFFIRYNLTKILNDQH